MKKELADQQVKIAKQIEYLEKVRKENGDFLEAVARYKTLLKPWEGKLLDKTTREDVDCAVKAFGDTLMARKQEREKKQISQKESSRGSR